MTFTFERGGYNDKECTELMCFPCLMPANNFFKIRGLPKELQTLEVVDIGYILNINLNNITFQGFSGLSFIVWDEVVENWVIKLTNKDLGWSFGSNFSPIGVHKWNLHFKKNMTLDLKLTQVNVYFYFYYHHRSLNCYLTSLTELPSNQMLVKY